MTTSIWYLLWVGIRVSKKIMEEGKDQETIQSSTTPDPGHIMGKWQKHKKSHIQKRLEASPFPAGNFKAARHRQGNMSKMNTNKQRSTKEDRGVPMCTQKRRKYSFISYLLWFLEEEILLIVLTLCPWECFMLLIFLNHLFRKKTFRNPRGWGGVLWYFHKYVGSGNF